MDVHFIELVGLASNFPSIFSQQNMNAYGFQQRTVHSDRRSWGHDSSKLRAFSGNLSPSLELTSKKQGTSSYQPEITVFNIIAEVHQAINQLYQV